MPLIARVVVRGISICQCYLHSADIGGSVGVMARRLIAYERLQRDGKLPLKPFLWYPKEEKERARIVADLLTLLGTENPNSYVHSEYDPSESESRLYATLTELPLDFARRVLDYAKSASQRDRDALQIALRFLRCADDRRTVLPDHRVEMLELYLSALPLFDAMGGGDIRELGAMLINHAEITKWEAHRNISARKFPNGYFLYTTFWPKTPLPPRDDLAWLDTNAMKLAKLSISDRGSFDRGYCEVLLESSATALISGAL